jgi:hypothetical protein
MTPQAVQLSLIPEPVNDDTDLIVPEPNSLVNSLIGQLSTTDLVVNVNPNNDTMTIKVDSCLVIQVGESRMVITPDYIQLVSDKIFLN